jgi:hypothetical protein
MKLSNGESILYCADLSHGNVVGGVRCLNLVDKTAPAPIEVRLLHLYYGLLIWCINILWRLFVFSGSKTRK